MLKEILYSMKIKKEMTVHSVLVEYPDTAAVFMSFGMHCLGCPGAVSETIEYAAKKHGSDLDEMLKKLNEATK